MRSRALIWLAAIIVLSSLQTSRAFADVSTFTLAKDPAYVTISGGYFDYVRGNDTGAEISLEYRSDYELGWFKPFAHGAYVTNGMTFLGAGLLLDLQVGDNWIVQPSFAPTWWRDKSGQFDLDLGSALEFRSRLEVAYRFENKFRLGVSITHTSNASTGDTNPGTEAVMLNVSVPTSMFALP
mgnify:FL=1